jgi:pimeloyl-ACP methyl ester carboxylesterase
VSHETANVSAEGAGTTFVLIPGAGADPRVYGATIGALRRLGHDGIAPPLPLDDADATPSDHADAILAALPDPLPDSLVVVGQSLGAYSATIAAARLRPSRLILLAPMIPARGESAGDWWEGTGYMEAVAERTERLGPPSEWDEAAMAEVFYHDVDAATLAASAEYEGVPSRGLFEEPLPVEPWPEVPTAVLIPRGDRMFPLEFQRRVARERVGVEIEEMEGGHLPFLSRPDELARRLVDLA